MILSLIQETVIKNVRIEAFAATKREQARLLKLLQKNVLRIENGIAEKDEVISKLRSITLF